MLEKTLTGVKSGCLGGPWLGRIVAALVGVKGVSSLVPRVRGFGCGV